MTIEDGTAMQVSDDDIHHTNTSATPRRIVESSLETPDLLNSVPLAVIDQHSRLGPEVDGSDGVFQTACPGKYSVNFGQALRDDFSQYSSQPMDLTTSTDASSRTASSSEALLPERTACRLEEAPEPLVAVTHACPSHPSSRSGAAVENGDGGFRSPSAGKYPFVSGVSIVDAPSCSSGQRETHINNRNSDLRIYYQNVRGLRTKIDDFFLAVGDEEYDVIVLTETWLDDAIHSAQLFANSYTVIRTDRSPMNSRKTKGGGVLIAISSRLSCIRESAAISDSLEQLWIRIDMRSYIISIGVIYLPPDRKNDVHAIEQHVESISAVISSLGTNDFALLFEDYNQSAIRWTSPDGRLAVDLARSRLSESSCAGLTQINTAENLGGRVLDLVLVNDVALPNCTYTPRR